MVEAERDAHELRARAWRKTGRDGMFLPIDPFQIAMDLGIRVYVGRGMPAELSGIARKEAGYEDPEIVLNADDSRNRQRFTCAHELGHYTHQVNRSEDDEWEYRDGRESLSVETCDPDEAYADHFAAELLMPRAIVVERTSVRASALAIDFGVAVDAIRFRLETLELM